MNTRREARLPVSPRGPKSVPSVVTAAAALAAAFWAACAPREDAGQWPDGRPRDAASSGHLAVPSLLRRSSGPGCEGRTDRAASLSGFRPHVEFTAPFERASGAVDWGNLRLVVRVVVRLGKGEPAGVGGQRAAVEEATLAAARAAARAAAERTAATVAAGVRVDSRQTLAGLVPDAGAIRRWTAAGLRLLVRRLLPTGQIEEVYELPLAGAGGIIDRLYERASRTADVPVRSAPGPAGPASAEASSGSAPVPPVACTLPAAIEDPWDIDRTLRFFKGVAAEPSSLGKTDELTPGIVIDARGTGLAPALFPAVLNEGGEPVYSAAVPRRERVVGEGLVQYVELEPGADLAELAQLPRLRPQVIVKAVAAEGPLRANAVLDAESARRLRAETGALKEARVVILLGE